MRATLSVLAGAAVAVVATALLGEYAFDGIAVLGAGIVIGLFVSEVIVSVARQRTVLLMAAGALLTVASLLGAAWIATSQRFSQLGWQGWLAILLGAVAAAIRARPLSARPDRRPAGSSPAG